MNGIIVAISSVTVIAAACAALLCIASKVMYVKVDERIEKIQEALPGSNCGACGFPGCSGYAEALVTGEGVKSNLCPPGGADAIKRISEILGVEAEAAVRLVAVVHCGGDSAAQNKKMCYTGIQTCYAAKQVFCGESACAYGCLGYGDCKIVCPENAICMENGLARINRNLCTGCGICVKACPNKIIAIESGDRKTVIACSNIEKAAAARKRCTKCCFGCGKCMRECPEKAIVIENNLAKIDNEKCTDCGHCAETCPTKCVQVFS